MASGHLSEQARPIPALGVLYLQLFCWRLFSRMPAHQGLSSKLSDTFLHLPPPRDGSIPSLPLQLCSLLLFFKRLVTTSPVYSLVGTAPPAPGIVPGPSNNTYGTPISSSAGGWTGCTMSLQLAWTHCHRHNDSVGQPVSKTKEVMGPLFSTSSVQSNSSNQGSQWLQNSALSLIIDLQNLKMPGLSLWILLPNIMFFPADIVIKYQAVIWSLKKYLVGNNANVHQLVNGWTDVVHP